MTSFLPWIEPCLKAPDFDFPSFAQVSLNWISVICSQSSDQSVMHPYSDTTHVEDTPLPS